MHWLLRLIGFCQPVRILRQETGKIQLSRTFRLVLSKPRMLGRLSGFRLLGLDKGGGYSLRLCFTEIATASAFAPELISLRTARHHHPIRMMRRRRRRLALRL
jgi:hypothetical protein